MSENKKIINYCPNFYKIIDFNPIAEDDITDKIISVYKEYIFQINLEDDEQVTNIKQLDEALSKYINDFAFRKEVKKEVYKVDKTDNNFLKKIVDAVLYIFRNYQEFTTRVIFISRWI